MKIVDVCAFLSPRGGGVKTYIEQKLAMAPALGHDMTVLAPGDVYGVTNYGANARVITLPSPRFPLDRNYWYFDDEAALHAALDKAAPDFVEVSSPWRSPAMVARWPGDVPRSLVMHADPLSAYAYRWFEPLLSREMIDRRFEIFWSHLREMGRSYDRVVCASRELQGRLAAGGVANTALHPMGVEEGLFTPARRDPLVRARLLELCELPETAHLLLGVGRLSAEKRWPLVIDAVAAAGQKHPIGLVILGHGKHHTRLLRQIAGNPHIKLLPPERSREAFATLLASGDALIHGCEAETFCMAAAEARASGLPVVVPDRGGASDHAGGGAGVTFRAGSALSAAAALEALLGADQLSSSAAIPRTMRQHFEALFADYAMIAEGAKRAA
jgi:alpha-1,6-mannosyltransferase